MNKKLIYKIRSDFAKELLDRLDHVAAQQPLLVPMIRVIQDHIREVRG